MRLNNLVAFAGFVVLIAGTYCPVLRPFFLPSWDVYDANKPYGMVLLLVAVVGIIGAVFERRQLLRFVAWLSLILVTLLLLLAWLKIHTSFSFIPFHGLQHLAEKGIKYRWGWFLLFGGAVLALAGALIRKRTFTKTTG